MEFYRFVCFQHGLGGCDQTRLRGLMGGGGGEAAGERSDLAMGEREEAHFEVEEVKIKELGD